jgi:hypothetical protein
MSLSHPSDLRELKDRFRAELSTDFGPRSLSAALEDVIDLILIARNRRVTWAQLAVALRLSLDGNGDSGQLNPATLRGLCGRIQRRRQTEALRRENARTVESFTAKPTGWRTDTVTASKPKIEAVTAVEKFSLIDRNEKPANFDDKANRLAEMHRRLRDIR